MGNFWASSGDGSKPSDRDKFTNHCQTSARLQSRGSVLGGKRRKFWFSMANRIGFFDEDYCEKLDFGGGFALIVGNHSGIRFNPTKIECSSRKLHKNRFSEQKTQQQSSAQAKNSTKITFLGRKLHKNRLFPPKSSELADKQKILTNWQAIDNSSSFAEHLPCFGHDDFVPALFGFTWTHGNC